MKDGVKTELITIEEILFGAKTIILTSLVRITEKGFWKSEQSEGIRLIHFTTYVENNTFFFRATYVSFSSSVLSCMTDS